MYVNSVQIQRSFCSPDTCIVLTIIRMLLKFGILRIVEMIGKEVMLESPQMAYTQIENILQNSSLLCKLENCTIFFYLFSEL